MWNLVGNPEDRFSHNEAQMRLVTKEDHMTTQLTLMHVQLHVSLSVSMTAIQNQSFGQNQHGYVEVYSRNVH